MPNFQIQDINIQDLDTRLIENLNRAIADMERAGVPNTLVASSGMRFAERDEALEHLNDPRLSQASVYSRANPRSGRSFAAARPGNSNHGHGRAIDFSPRLSGPALTWLRANAGRYGLEHLRGNFDIPHIQLQNARGNVGARPSAQEQAEQRALDAQNRQAAIDRGLIAPGRGNQQAGVPMPRGRPTDVPQPEIAQPDVAPPAATRPPPEAPLPPAETPAPVAPVDRPPADIPTTLTPPRAGRADPAMLTRTALDIIKQSTAKLTTSAGQAEFNAAGVVAAKGLAAAGVPLDMARSLMTKSAYEGAEKVGYGPSATLWSIYKGAIDSGIAAALQGYQPARPGEVQGPPAPAQQRSEAPFGGFGTRFLAKGGRVDEDEPVVVGEEGPELFVPDQSGTVVPHMPQPGKPGNVDRWPKIPASEYPGRYGGVEREIRRQTRDAQDPAPSLMDLIDSERLRLNAANWHAMMNDPSLIALGRSRMDDRRQGIDPGAEQYGAFIPPPTPAAEPPDPTSPMAQALGYGSIRRPLRVGRQIY